MASSGPNDPDTVANSAEFGDTAWINPGNAAAAGGSAASTALSLGMGLSTNYLIATDFDFAIPDGAVIDGITVEINRYCASEFIRDSRVRLVKGGTVQATDKASVSTWPTVPAYATYGGAADLWSGTWTDDDVNATTFGVALSAQSLMDDVPSVDHMRITITYTEAAGSAAVVSRIRGGAGMQRLSGGLA